MFSWYIQHISFQDDREHIILTDELSTKNKRRRVSIEHQLPEDDLGLLSSPPRVPRRKSVCIDDADLTPTRDEERA